MAGDVRERQNNTQSSRCGGSPVSGAALTSLSHESNGTASHRVGIKEQAADASKVTSPSPSQAGSASASPIAETPVTSHSAGMSHQPSVSPSPNDSPSPSMSHSASHSSVSTPTSPALESSPESSSEPSPSFVKDSSTSVASSPTKAESSTTSTIEASSSSESAAISATSQASSTRGSSIELPGLAAASPPSSSKPIDVEAAPPTAPSSSVSSTSSPANEAADAPASTTTANQDGNTSAPPAATSSTTQLASSSPEPPGQSTTLPSAIVNPGASDSTVLSSSPSTLMTDITSTSTSIAMATSMSFSVTDPSDTAGSGTNSVGSPSGGATPTPTSRRAGDIELQTNDGPSGPPTGMIIGGAVGGAAALAMIALLFWLWRRRSNKKRQLGQPRTPLSERPGGGSQLSGGAAATAGPFAAGRPASTRAKNPLQGWWAAHGVGNNAPLITPEYGEKQAATVQPVPARARRASLEQRALQNPFSDAHSTEVRIAAAITPQQQQQQQQRLRGILKQPMPTLHSSHPSDASSVVAAAAGAARRSRAHSASGQRASQRMLASRRTSSLTNDPFEERRTKFRSDPFDLELDTRMLSSSSFSSSAIPQKDPRASSVYSANTGTSSRYTSGLSSTWGAEPAVAVAPLVVGGGGRSGVSDSPTLPQEPRRGGGFGGGIVGQAM